MKKVRLCARSLRHPTRAAKAALVLDNAVANQRCRRQLVPLTEHKRLQAGAPGVRRSVLQAANALLQRCWNVLQLFPAHVTIRKRTLNEQHTPTCAHRAEPL